jgi:redox-sensitive bicupin YhaK (pirin superfamily)
MSWPLMLWCLALGLSSLGVAAAASDVDGEVPAIRGRELHGLQLFVNLSAKNKLTAPQVLHLEPSQVPQWRGADDVSSPLVPAEPFTLLDVHLQQMISFGLPAAHNAVVYVLSGYAAVGPAVTRRSWRADTPWRCTAAGA